MVMKEGKIPTSIPVIRIRTKSQWGLIRAESHLPSKFSWKLFSSFGVLLLTNQPAIMGENILTLW